jgi:hypothetical protein
MLQISGQYRSCYESPSQRILAEAKIKETAQAAQIGWPVVRIKMIDQYKAMEKKVLT